MRPAILQLRSGEGRENGSSAGVVMVTSTLPQTSQQRGGGSVCSHANSQSSERPSRRRAGVLRAPSRVPEPESHPERATTNHPSSLN